MLRQISWFLFNNVFLTMSFHESLFLFYIYIWNRNTFCSIQSFVDKFFSSFSCNFFLQFPPSMMLRCLIVYVHDRLSFSFLNLFWQTFSSSCYIFSSVFILLLLRYPLNCNAKNLLKNSSWFLFNNAFLWSYFPFVVLSTAAWDPSSINSS